MTSTSSDLVTCRNTAEFLRVLPKLLGFTATNSLFVIFFSGKRAQRSARLTLPEPFGGPAEQAYVEGVSDMIRDLSTRFRATDDPVLVITTSASFAQNGGAPHRSFAQRMRRCLLRDGITLRDFCVVASDGWGEYDDAHLPVTGRALELIAPFHAATESSSSCNARSRITGQHTVSGRHNRCEDASASAPASATQKVRVPALTELEAIPAANASKVALAAAVSKELAPLPRAAAAKRHDPDAPRRMREVGAVTRALIRFDSALQPRMVARLLRLTSDTDLWFALALAILTRAEAPEEIVRGGERTSFTQVPLGGPHLPAGDEDHDGDEEGSPAWSIYSLLANFSAECEHPRVFVSLRKRMNEVLESTAEADRPHLLALSSWVWWTSGIQTVALAHIAEGLRIDPANELCRMVNELVDVPLFGRRPLPADEPSDCRVA